MNTRPDYLAILTALEKFAEKLRLTRNRIHAEMNCLNEHREHARATKDLDAAVIITDKLDLLDHASDQLHLLIEKIYLYVEMQQYNPSIYQIVLAQYRNNIFARLTHPQVKEALNKPTNLLHRKIAHIAPRISSFFPTVETADLVENSLTAMDQCIRELEQKTQIKECPEKNEIVLFLKQKISLLPTLVDLKACLNQHPMDKDQIIQHLVKNPTYFKQIFCDPILPAVNFSSAVNIAR